MNKNRQNIPVVLLVAACLWVINLDAKETDPNPDEEALTLQSIEKIFAANDGEIDLNKTLLTISRQASLDLVKEDFQIPKFERQLAKMAEELAALLKSPPDNKSILEIINKYILEDQAFHVDRSKLFESNLDSLLFNRVLTQKRGQCLSLSLLYLCLAERLNLPLYGVMVPGHFFVRYDNNGSSLNIETTDRGAAYPDEYYQKVYLTGLGDEGSLRNLSKKEVIAIYLSNLANQYKLKGDHQKAIDIFQLVMTIIPDDASLYTNLGNTYERDGQINKAISSYRQALSFNPYLCEAHYNLGLIHYLYTRQYDDARRHGEVARKLGCRMHPEFKNFLENNK